MSLKSFLKQSANLPENQKVAVSSRFLDDGGKPEEWEIQAITSGREEELRAACTKRVPVPGKKGAFTESTDQQAYLRKLAVACIVYPNLSDAELQNSYGVMGAEELIREMLLPGEFAALLDKIGAVTGFDASFEDKVEEAKN